MSGTVESTAIPPAATQITRAHRLFRALSDATRLKILSLLAGGERCVCELTDSLGAAQSRLSFHLRVLKDAGLVTDRRDGRWIYYQVNRDVLAEVSGLVGQIEVGFPEWRSTGECCQRSGGRLGSSGTNGPSI